MSNPQEKVKDLVEVVPFKSPVDFLADQAFTVESYRFTDITSNLMAGWLDTLASGTASGTCRALAGFRGVGKSHFMALFGAIIANPEFRSRISDSHVATSANTLLRRRYHVASVRRGTRESLFEEVKAAIAVSLGTAPEAAPDNLDSLLAAATEKSGDMPYVILIDTAFDRKSRVQRDDGAFLAELAAGARSRGMFVAVALDDDITDANGSNAAIVQYFAVDYLEQEHLYKIVDTHIFRKNRLKRSVVDQAYTFFKTAIPDFRWSEQRFASLYPLHPLILEIAPVVRLYAPDFALLAFASEAGKRILGRPFRSLIGLDEVFDSVEPTLRKDADLKDAFAVYDKISGQVPSLVPVFQRLQAKLVLKALFILSLEGEGVTAGEISAAIMIYEEDDPSSGANKVSELVEAFAAAFPDDLWRVEDHSGELRYSLKVSGKDNLNHALSSALGRVGESVVSPVLKKVGGERYPDWPFRNADDESGVDWTDIETVWRGSVRKVRLFWNWENDEVGSLGKVAGGQDPDVLVVITSPGEKPGNTEKGGVPVVTWTPSSPSGSEVETIKRYHLLVSDEAIRGEFKEQIGAAGHTLSVALEKIWKRMFLKDGVFSHAGERLKAPDGIESRPQANAMLSDVLAPVLDSCYPEHPVFGSVLGMEEVSLLVSDLFSGARVGQQNVQSLAKDFALPLGLAALEGDEYVLEKEERLFALHHVEKVLSLVGFGGEETVSLENVYQKLREEPYGLTKEAQRLILSAVVAHGKIEFVTDRGDRISRRSLDLKIIWEDIAGISKPQDVHYGSARLTEWAKLLTGLENVGSIDVSDDRMKVRDALEKWAEGWQTESILERFGSLNSDVINTKIWYTAMAAERSFGTVFTALRGLLDESLSLEETLQRIADTFSDSEKEFEQRSSDLLTVANFTAGAKLRLDANRYLSVCEITDDREIEAVRSRLEELLSEAAADPSAETNAELEASFERFREMFSVHYSNAHKTVAGCEETNRKVEEIVASDEWWEFKNLSALPIIAVRRGERASSALRRIQELNCSLDVRSTLRERPFCPCGFRLADAGTADILAKDLIAAVLQSNESFRRTLAAAADVLQPLIERISKELGREADAAELCIKLRKPGDSTPFTTSDLQMLAKACEAIENSPVINIGFPNMSDFLIAEELGDRLASWASELPDEPIFLNVS